MSADPLVVYAGGFPLPDHRASALRAIANARLMKSAGVEPVVAGRFVAGHDGRRSIPAGGEGMRVGGIACRNIEAAGGATARSYLASAAPVRAVAEEFGAARLLAIVAYNYPARALCDLLRLSRRLAVPLVAECTEWTGMEGRNVARGLAREIGAAARMTVLARRAGHTICATRHAAAHFRGTDTLVLPWVLEEVEKGPLAPPQETVRFVYAGSPGLRFSKERVDAIVAALAQLADHPRPFTLDLTMRRDEFLAAAPHLSGALDRLAGRMTFHGWLARHPLEALLGKAHVSVFARPDTRATRFGFPTKLAEAIRFRLPVVANLTGDVGLHVREGETGWLAAGPHAAALVPALRRALETPPHALRAMRVRIGAENPFAPERYAAPLGAFLDRLAARRHEMRGAA